MKSIVVVYPGRHGAGPIFAYEMTKSFVEQGHNVYAIVFDTVDNIKDFESLSLAGLVKIKGYSNILSFILNSINFQLFIKIKIKRYFDSKPADICYVPMIQPWTLPLLRIFKKSIKVVTVHDPEPHLGAGLYSIVCDKVAFAADKLVILSEAFKEYTSQRFKKRIEDVIVIPHGVFKYPESNFIAKKHYTKDYNFLFFGRITPYKGLDLLADAYGKLVQERSDISLTIAGSGDYSKYKSLYLGMPNVTIDNRFIPDDEVSSFFGGKNIITILPYIEATQSGVVMVAMEEKSLLIVTNTGGLLEQTQNGKLAVVSEPNAMSIKKAMVHAIEHYDELQETVSKAKEYIDSLTWDILSKRLLDQL